MRAILTMMGFGVLLAACSGHDDPAGQKLPATGGPSAVLPTTGDDTTGGNTAGGNTAEGPTSTGRVALDVKAFCARAVTTCGDGSVPESDCEAMFGAVRVSKACETALLNASCADLSNGTGAVDECFPSCSSPGASSCNNDGTLSVCGQASKALVYDCATMCTQVGKTGTGNCGQAADTQGGSSQQDRCLCK
jgi:hypothetical protein